MLTTPHLVEERHTSTTAKHLPPAGSQSPCSQYRALRLQATLVLLGSYKFGLDFYEQQLMLTAKATKQLYRQQHALSMFNYIQLWGIEMGSNRGEITFFSGK
ncbi:unnamed protein product [Ceratitis capitata]|uniref:(Mediterranean fruit fly) hypothetical protein n=1 Tax=Ceratitis capitata TaxID=7213 RepID=A0A811U6H7_CERCA|nr:unnamed protein product [Ceratitis capitata]